MSTHPKRADYRVELQKAGLSEKCIDGLMNVGGTAYVNFEKNYGPSPNFQDAIEAVCKMFMENKKFMKIQSEEDQKKYAIHLENQKQTEEAYLID
ncbi:unnamed protein product [Caenorhabditis nigoni]